jgi:hypothetical protein
MEAPTDDERINLSLEHIPYFLSNGSVLLVGIYYAARRVPQEDSTPTFATWQRRLAASNKPPCFAMPRFSQEGLYVRIHDMLSYPNYQATKDHESNTACRPRRRNP